MSYQVNTDDVFVPSKSVEVFPLSRQDIRPNGDGISQVQINLLPSLGFVNPDVKLRYKCKFEGRGQPHCSSDCGVNAFWRHQRIITADGLNILSETDEQSSLVAMGWSYSENDGEIHNRSINEGLVKTTNNRNILFWPAKKTPTETIVDVPVAKTIQINQPIYSGVFDKQIVPVNAMGGLNVILQTNNTMKSVQTTPADFENAVEVQTTKVKGAFNNPSTATNVVVKVKGEIGNPNTNVFEIGDKVYATDTTEANSFPVGVIVSVGVDSGNVALTINGFNAANTDLTADLTADTTKLFVKSSDRWTGYSTGANVPNTTDALKKAISQASKKISWTLSDVKMSIEMLVPPKSYINDMEKKMRSDSGYKFNFKHSVLKRVNIQGVNGLLSANINVGNEGKRCYAINVMPLKNNDVYNSHNLVANGSDYAEEYQFLIGNQNIPDQRCDLRKLSLTPPKINQLALQETRKSLINSSIMVRNLQNPQKNFVIGRAVSEFGHTSNITGSDLVLRVMYGTQATLQKVFLCFICSQRTLVIRDTDMMVVD